MTKTDDKPAAPTIYRSMTPGGLIEHDIEDGLTARQYAAIHLCVPDSGEPWLDAMIQRARRDRFLATAMRGLLASGPHDCLHRELLVDAKAIASAMKQEGE